MPDVLLEPRFFDRDLSWLQFNGRVLDEAINPDLPVLERIKFLAIFSSNLDEFYRVRMPVLLALKKISSHSKNMVVNEDLLSQVRQLIEIQQNNYGLALVKGVIPALKQSNIHLVYNEPLPELILQSTLNYFLANVLGYLRPVDLSSELDFFPENNQLYFLVNLLDSAQDKLYALNIPSDYLPRFYKTNVGEITYIVFLDDIIRYHLSHIFKNAEILGCFSFKVTRDAEIDLKDEYPGSISDQIENQLKKRDFGLATRFLHQPEIPDLVLKQVKKYFNLKNVSLVQGGNYHNLKDFFAFPVQSPALSDLDWPALNPKIDTDLSVHEVVRQQDILISTPYQSYDAVLRFFNEAAIDKDIKEIYTTIYRVAQDSKIANALISAAKNGKKVVVLVELKARFDEENNMIWAKKMKAAGVEVLYSVTALKVHAKITLVKRQVNNRLYYTGLISTGNFNERTARTYTDHVLITANKKILREVELLFIFLAKRIKPNPDLNIDFKHLLVAQFNMQQRFMELIDREIEFANQGKPASITIKLNNLEEKKLITKLYEASNAGVKINLIVRSICCLMPGIEGMSANIKVTRVVDRYLEHSRVFAFHNGGDTEVFMGSADWMNRNIYRRIEVCIPIYDSGIKTELLSLLHLTETDNVKAVNIDKHLNNAVVKKEGRTIQSQYEIYQFLSNKESL